MLESPLDETAKSTEKTWRKRKVKSNKSFLNFIQLSWVIVTVHDCDCKRNKVVYTSDCNFCLRARLYKNLSEGG